jgi:hypothetical protein
VTVLETFPSEEAWLLVVDIGIDIAELVYDYIQYLSLPAYFLKRDDFTVIRSRSECCEFEFL